jgi:hypothetical protein
VRFAEQSDLPTDLRDGEFGDNVRDENLLLWK